MAKKRVTRKQLLKEPDEFITTTGRIIQWAKANQKMLVIGSAAFFAAIIAISVYGYFNEKRSNAAQLMLSQAMQRFQTEEATSGTADALAAVSTDFDNLIESYGNMPAGQLGRVYYGHISTAGKAYDKAIENYQKALDDLGYESSLTNIILNGLGTAYQQIGEYPKAVDAFRKVADGTSPILKDAALFNLGKLYGQLGKTEESTKAFQQLRDDFPESMYAGLVREKQPG